MWLLTISKILCWILEKFRNWFELIWNSDAKDMKEIKKKRKRKRNKKRKTTLLGPAQAGQPTKAPSSFFFSCGRDRSHPQPPAHVRGRETFMAVYFPLPSPIYSSAPFSSIPIQKLFRIQRRNHSGKLLPTWMSQSLKQYSCTECQPSAFTTRSPSSVHYRKNRGEQHVSLDFLPHFCS
jgi:hypothetical protein